MKKICFLKEKKIINKYYFENRIILKRLHSGGENFSDIRKISLLAVKSLRLYTLYYNTFRNSKKIDQKCAGEPVFFKFCR